MQNPLGSDQPTFDLSAVGFAAQHGQPVQDDLMKYNDVESGKMHYMSKSRDRKQYMRKTSCSNNIVGAEQVNYLHYYK